MNLLDIELIYKLSDGQENIENAEQQQEGYLPKY